MKKRLAIIQPPLYFIPHIKETSLPQDVLHVLSKTNNPKQLYEILLDTPEHSMSLLNIIVKNAFIYLTKIKTPQNQATELIRIMMSICDIIDHKILSKHQQIQILNSTIITGLEPQTFYEFIINQSSSITRITDAIPPLLPILLNFDPLTSIRYLNNSKINSCIKKIKKNGELSVLIWMQNTTQPPNNIQHIIQRTGCITLSPHIRNIQKPIVLNLAFRPESIIGKGTFGKVHIICDHYVAKESQDQESVHTEITALNLLHQTHDPRKKFIISPLATFMANNYYYLILPLYYFDLNQAIIELGRQPKKPDHKMLSMLWTHHLLSGISYLHDHHIIHTDIKPSNCLINHKTHQLIIIDFGLASTTKNYDSIPQADGKNVVGTRGYRAPERLRIAKNPQAFGYEIDSWGVGCVIWEIMTKTQLFPAKNEDELIAMMLYFRPFPKSFFKETLLYEFKSYLKTQRILPKKNHGWTGYKLHPEHEIGTNYPYPFNSAFIDTQFMKLNIKMIIRGLMDPLPKKRLTSAAALTLLMQMRQD